MEFFFFLVICEVFEGWSGGDDTIDVPLGLEVESVVEI